MKYVSVIVDNASNSTDQFYTYRCSDDRVRVGDVVKVPFAKRRKDVTGYVFGVSDRNDDKIKRLRDVSSISEEYSLPEDLIRLSAWMKRRYMCRYIDAVKCMIPPGSKPSRVIRDPLEEFSGKGGSLPELTDEQRAAFEKLLPELKNRESSYFLLNGVTSSGKTEVFLRAAAETLRQGRDVIVLVPEISLTPQTIDRFTSRFGRETVAVIHSRLTKAQRYQQWMRARNGEARIMIGARSAILAPLGDPGLIIIDEEHESSYKADQTPKYDAISAALMRGRMSGAVVLLGTATPSVVSMYRSRQGYYRELKLTKRHNETPLPHVSIADMRRELKEGNHSVFSRELYSKMRSALDEGKQIILFLNRRGYSSFISCRSCGFVVRCSECGISMTYHKSSGMAECHYCGRKWKVPDTCPECGSRYIRYFGAGTEQLEEAAGQFFPDASVARLDLDLARKKGESRRILNAFRRGKTDILVGTQLVAKGLDFDNVGVVGIVAADVTLNVPDYRSAERTYQLIVQAAGRAGRGREAGEVVIQTYSPEDPVIQSSAAGDYESFYGHEIRMRSFSGYPPFTNILRLVFSGEKESAVAEEAEAVYHKIVASGLPEEGELFRPQPAYMAFLSGKYRYQILVKSPINKTKYYRKLIEDIKKEREKEKSSRKEEAVIMVAELDPYSLS